MDETAAAASTSGSIIPSIIDGGSVDGRGCVVNWRWGGADAETEAEW